MLDKQDIIDAILYEKEHTHGDIKFTNELMSTVYKILFSFFCEEKDFVLLQAPTGSGKSIIGFITAECVNILLEKEHNKTITELRSKLDSQRLEPSEAANIQNKIDEINKDYESIFPCYYLTSSKMLQDQIDKDIKRFDFDNMFMLKGTDNYVCNFESKRIMGLRLPYSEKQELLKKATYKYRPCINERKPLEETEYSECSRDCPYRVARYFAITSPITILNYHYFATVFNSPVKLFNTRFLTICDEAHKLSEVIDSLFTCTINVNVFDDLEKLISKLKQLRFAFDDNIYNNDTEYISSLKENFITSYIDKNRMTSLISKLHDEVNDEIIPFLNTISEAFDKSTNKANISHVIEKTGDLSNRFKNLLMTLEYYKNALNERPSDIFYKFDKVSRESKYFYIEIKDLNETHMLQDKFVRHCNKVLFMSATMGDLSEFATIYGLDFKKCSAITLPNKFDYSKSPIYLCNAGNLRKKDFEQNINHCIDVVLEILKMHPNEKGIVHTHTFGINKILRLKILGDSDDSLMKRCLFYDNAYEKKSQILKMYKENFPYVIIGPSLVEGLDLKYDMGRFNIMIKTPYPPITDYANAKMKYCSFWYERMTKEAIVQSIGRTNRAIDDQSTVYLIDTGFNALIRKIDASINSRLQSKTITLKNAVDESFDVDDLIRENNVNKSMSQPYFSTDGDLPF